MKAFFEIPEVLQRFPESPATDWTVVIPAAGTGGRLGYERPKILYPILDRTILDWLIELFVDRCHRFVLVLSPGGAEQVSREVARRLGQRASWVLQEQPLGMADAIWQTRDAVDTPATAVVWGDQVTLAGQTVEACLRLHAARDHATLTLPTAWKERPYIHIVRDHAGRIVKVLEAREVDTELPAGENDCGLFAFSTEALFGVLGEARARGLGVGAETRELNLLPLLPHFEVGAHAVATLRLAGDEETLGVNSEEDARLAAKILRSRTS